MSITGLIAATLLAVTFLAISAGMVWLGKKLGEKFLVVGGVLVGLPSLIMLGMPVCVVLSSETTPLNGEGITIMPTSVVVVEEGGKFGDFTKKKY